jgi:hypothetical protein
MVRGCGLGGTDHGKDRGIGGGDVGDQIVEIFLVAYCHISILAH